MRRQATSLILVTVGATLAVTGAVLSRETVPDTFGEVPQTVVVGSTPIPSISTPQPARQHVVQPELPLQISIPSLSANASVVPIGVTRTRTLLLPPPDQIGWWAGGATPDATSGTTVLAGHVDTPTGEQGALYALSAIRPDAKVLIRTTTGTRTYRITALRTYPRRHLPPDLFGRDGARRLVLITCGGQYSPTTGYARNVVAFASPDH